MEDFKPGDRVHYVPTKENGIIKSLEPKNVNGKLLDKKPRVDVVYHCNNNWKQYNLYPGISTRVENLKKGWIPGHTRTD